MRKFQVDPRTQLVIAFVAGLISFLGSNSLPAEVPQHVAAAVKDWSIWFGQFYLIVIAPLLLAYTNSNPGPLAPPDPPEVVKAHEEAVPVSKP